MPILIVLLVVVALVWGAIWSFQTVAAQFGVAVASALAVLVIAVLALAMAAWWRRRRAVAPNHRDGDWTHELAGAWGRVRLAAGKRLCELQVNGEQGSYIFADLVEARVEPREGAADGAPCVALKVKDARHGLWHLPMRDGGEAKRWCRIFGLAIRQALPG